ncbi:PepSY domain-containing protein [Mycolicibacterium sp. HK-90]|uniref:PepSY domain-containing protein n=1 Tax=Mycolicibacterium sp. HK-90 TaxID=3056937 RepID=UPI0026590E8F|nr:PepSY domain-containing protein [Mycolicibacterium sp. HK-90]WKG02062.1 PepSY domain-containing protein [Mycolicibacterium sp. HK-90]
MLGNSTPATAILRTAGAATVMAAVVACGGGESPTASSPEPQDGTTTAAPAAPAPTSVQPSAGDNSALLAAADTARGAVPDSTVYAIDSERNGTQWEVQVITADGVKHEAEISADGATILNGPIAKPDDPEDVAEHRNHLQAAKLDFRAAVDAVTKAVDGRITELGLDDRDGGTVVWEADVIDSSNALHDVSIDAATGAVVAKN